MSKKPGLYFKEVGRSIVVEDQDGAEHARLPLPISVDLLNDVCRVLMRHHKKKKARSTLLCGSPTPRSVEERLKP